ncbi:DEAD-box ATP-dependent RNA helicase 50 [Glycine soja]|nr:DEAD-box ATP-dependent RNA helicase 50 [Glycine soja]
MIPNYTPQSKSATDTKFFSLKSFKEIGCSEYMIESLQKLLLSRPSHVQAMAFAPVISGKTCVIADQSGSGKTLAYLAPIIQLLRLEELEGRSSKSSSQAPRVLVLAPTAELASQVLDNCRSLSKSGVPFKSMVVTGGFRQKTQLENLQQGVDVLIATPGRFLFLIHEGFLQLTNLRCAILDEVDILFGDEDFEVALQSLINSSPVDTQYLFVTATLPKNVYTKLVEVFPDCEMIMGPGMHRISSRLQEIIVDCSGEDGQEKTPDTAFLNKKTALLQLVEENPVPRTIVFCNKIETCRKVENLLKRFDRKGNHVQVLPFHAAMTQESRLASMEEFTRSPSKGVSQFMVCTDRASRGIDFTRVDHVILFDFPRDPSEYVRRVGRTARGAKGVGKAFIFVVGKQVSLARKIMERNQKGHPLHDVPSAY